MKKDEESDWRVPITVALLTRPAWELSPAHRCVLVTILLKVNREDHALPASGKWPQQMIKRGEWLTTIPKLATWAGVTYDTARRAVEQLVNMEVIATRSISTVATTGAMTRRATIITLLDLEQWIGFRKKTTGATTGATTEPRPDHDRTYVDRGERVRKTSRGGGAPSEPSLPENIQSVVSRSIERMGYERLGPDKLKQVHSLVLKRVTEGATPEQLEHVISWGINRIQCGDAFPALRDICYLWGSSFPVHLSNADADGLLSPDEVLTRDD